METDLVKFFSCCQCDLAGSFGQSRGSKDIFCVFFLESDHSFFGKSAKFFRDDSFWIDFMILVAGGGIAVMVRNELEAGSAGDLILGSVLMTPG